MSANVMNSCDTDEPLCYCEDAGPEGKGIGQDAWLRAVRENPELDFYQLCNQLNVGRRCTACLLNAEALFDGVVRNKSSGQALSAVGSPAKRIRQADRQTNPASWRQWLYRGLDAILPSLPTTHELCIPVIRGVTIRTVLKLSNCFPASIGLMSAPYRYEVTTLDTQGNMLRKRVLKIEAGNSEDIDLTEDLEEHGVGEFATGSCWIAMRPLATGFSGSTRPHFKLVGANGVSAVHAQSKSPSRSTQALSCLNALEHHFIHMINVEKRANPYVIRTKTTGSGSLSKEITGVLPPRGAALIELTPMAGSEIYLVEAESQARWRYHYLIADPDFTRMSADHA